MTVQPRGDDLVAVLSNDTSVDWVGELRMTRASAWPASDIEVGVTKVRGGVDVTLTARALAVDVALLVDKIVPHAVAAEGLFTLLPGESRTVHVTGLTVQDAGALADPRVLRTANQLVTPHLVLDGGVR